MGYQIFRSLYIMAAVIFSVVCVLGVVGNGVVIWVTAFRMKRTVSSVWYLNLAVADFLVTASLPLQITFYALEGDWPFGWFMCKMDGVFFHMNMYSSIYTLVVISVDRCVCVVCPVFTQNHRSVRNASWVSVGVWLLALAPSIPNIMARYWNTRRYDTLCYDPYGVLHLGITNSVLGFLVPFSVIVSCYSVIVHRLRNNRSLVGQSRRSYRIIAAVIVAFFLCWSPYHIIRLIDACSYNYLVNGRYFNASKYGGG